MRKNDKFKSVRKNNRLTQAEMALLLDVKQPFITAVEKGVSSLSKEKAEILAEKFNLDIEWLLSDDVELKNEVTAMPHDDYMMVEYVDLSAEAGQLGAVNVDKLPDTKKRLIPKEFDRGNYLVIRVNGDSMVDGTDISIPDGSEILVKEYQLEPGESLPIRNNLFVICSREGNVFKQITEHNLDQGYVKCHSYNKRYKDFKIDTKDIFQVFIYRKVVSIRPSIPDIGEIN